MAQHPEEIQVHVPTITLDSQKILEEFKQDCMDRHLTEETIARYLSPLRIFLAFIKERGMELNKVDRHVLKDFIHQRRNYGGKYGNGVDQKTLENNFSALSTFYEFLTFEGYVSNNPVLPVRKRYLTRYKEDDEDDESPRKLISIDEMVMLINSILSIRDKAVVTLLAKTGVRRSELISMDADDINWAEGSITLKRKRFKKRSNRIVFFDDETARILKRWMALREKMNPETKALFVGEHGERLNRNGVYSLVTKYAQAVGLHNPESNRIEDHFSPHCCRHWFTTWLRRAGMSKDFIKVLRGDRRRDAVDIYDHIDKEELRRAYLTFIPQLGI